LLYAQLLYPHELATPTYRILWENRKTKALGPDGKFQFPIITKAYSPSVAAKNTRFDFRDIDNITLSEWEGVFLKNGAGTNKVEMRRYGSNLARMDHISTKVASMHRGTTDVINWELWWDWNTADIAADNRVNLNTQLTSLEVPPEELYLENIAANTDAIYSIPMLTRKVVTGYTLAGITVTTTTNQYWHPTNTDATGATVTRSGSGNNIDCVTAITAATCKELDLDDLFEHLDAISQGWQYRWYAACPPALYRQLRNLITAMNIREHDSPLAELGIRASIEASEYNCIFYQEPIMKALHPNSIFFYDTDALYLQFEEGFAPDVEEWEKIPGTNMYGTSEFLSYQLVRPDARGVSAMHGYKAS